MSFLLFFKFPAIFKIISIDKKSDFHRYRFLLFFSFFQIILILTTVTTCTLLQDLQYCTLLQDLQYCTIWTRTSWLEVEIWKNVSDWHGQKNSNSMVLLLDGLKGWQPKSQSDAATRSGEDDQPKDSARLAG